MKRVLVGGLVLILVLVGCSGLGGEPVVTGTPMPTPTGSLVLPDNPPPPDQPWISPGKVQVGSFYPGAQADWGVLVHNGYQPAEIGYTVGTEVGETTVGLGLQKALKGGDVKNVLGLTSSLETDRPVALSYDLGKREIKIGGLTPASTRVVTVRYDHWEYSTYAVYYKTPNALTEGYSVPPSGAKDWIIISDPSPVLAPFETREIQVSVVMPAGASAPNKWEFWIGVKDSSQGGMVQIELSSRWLVSMR